MGCCVHYFQNSGLAGGDSWKCFRKESVDKNRKPSKVLSITSVKKYFSFKHKRSPQPSIALVKTCHLTRLTDNPGEINGMTEQIL